MDVCHVGEALEALLALGADEGELGGLGQTGEGAVKVQDHAQLGAHLKQQRGSEIDCWEGRKIFTGLPVNLPTKSIYHLTGRHLLYQSKYK